MLTLTTHRPRNVDAPRAAALFYGDWGTSKAYVIGLAFAIAGYASFWLILAVSALSLLVGLNYVIICKYYPNGGGVYASVRRRSKLISIIGAFFLVADYLVTAALSALSAFNYFNIGDPVLLAAIFIGIIGLLNYFGPRKTGTFAYLIAIAAVAVFTLLALTSLPFLHRALENLQPLQGDSFSIWAQFCSVIVALSGVETIANITGIMRLNKGSTIENPIVTRTSSPAIIWVMIEVIVYTTLFGLAATAISGFQFSGDTVSAPGFPNARDYMLRFLGMNFGTQLFGPLVGEIFGIVISIVVGFILLSAVNTALNGLVSLQYLMASDEELPNHFRKTNRFGVPVWSLLLATVIPMILILSFKNIAYLASLYAIGFVGAIATNLGSTSTDFKLPLKRYERVFMFAVFLIMALIELTLFFDKPHARYFVISLMAAGMVLRWITKKFQRKEPIPTLAPVTPEPVIIGKGAILCVVRGVSKALKEAIEKSNQEKVPLNVLFVKEQKVISETDLMKTRDQDPAAKRVYDYAKVQGEINLLHFHYSVTDSLADIVAAYSMRLEIDLIIIDEPKFKVWRLIRENHVRELNKILPTGVSIQVIKS